MGRKGFDRMFKTLVASEEKKQADPLGNNTAAASIKRPKINLVDTILNPSA